MEIIPGKEEKLRSDCTRTREASLPYSPPKFSLTRTGKLILGFFGGWLGFIILIKIVTMVIRALSNY